MISQYGLKHYDMFGPMKHTTKLLFVLESVDGSISLESLLKSLKSPSGLTHGRGLSQSVLHTWVENMHECASLHVALKSVVGLQQNEAAHTDCGKARMKRDETDCRKIIDWLRTYNPFSLSDQRLSS